MSLPTGACPLQDAPAGGFLLIPTAPAGRRPRPADRSWPLDILSVLKTGDSYGAQGQH